MKKKDGRRDLDGKKSFPARKTAKRKQDGGGVTEAEKEESRADNGVTMTNLNDMGLSKPQGCSRSFMDADGESWEEFEGKFLMYALATDLAKESGDVQVMMLLMSLDGEAVEVYESFTYATGESQHNLQCVLSKYAEYYSASRESRRTTNARGRAANDDVTTQTHTEDHEGIWRQGYSYVWTDEHGTVIYRGHNDPGMCDDDDEADSNDEHEDEDEADGNEGSERRANQAERGTTPAVPKIEPEIVPQEEVPQDPVPEIMPQEDAPMTCRPREPTAQRPRTVEPHRAKRRACAEGKPRDRGRRGWLRNKIVSCSLLYCLDG